MAEITKDMMIGDVVRKHPETIEVFINNGLHCIGCAMAGRETVEMGAKGHGIDVKKMVAELNKVIKKK